MNHPSDVGPTGSSVDERAVGKLVAVDVLGEVLEARDIPRSPADAREGDRLRHKSPR